MWRFEMPLIWLRDTTTGKIRRFGENHHDRLYLDAEGNIQYTNLQNGDGTVGGGYEFVLDDKGHNAKNMSYTEEEQKAYGLSYEDCWFETVDPADYGLQMYRIEIDELTNIRNKWFVKEVLKDEV